MHLSFWERQTYFEDVDLLIIGAGMVGLNAALAVRSLKPRWKILVIDRGEFLPYGASTRNAGFACFGSISELLDDLRTSGEDEVFALVQRRWEGLKKLRALLSDEVLEYEGLGGYEVFTGNDQDLFEACAGHLEDFNKKMEPITGIRQTYAVVSEKKNEFGFRGVEQLILNRGEGQLHTGKMMQALLACTRERAVEVLNGIEVKGWHSGQGSVLLETSNGFSFRAQKVLVTTNAFARQLLPELNVVPGRAQVLITAPVKNLKIRGSFHYDKGYYYFRNVGDRVLFGGGRNLDFEGEKTWEFGLTDRIQTRLEELLREIILPDEAYTIEQRWSGIMGLGDRKSAIIRKAEDRIYCAVRMGGMGVAIGSLVGEDAARMLVED
ncbi:MAG: FAD-binding oxidoreductase [Bacteroidia bacterium]|nr:FAD-binding oxidoreductase [Bacteroidia bacterium]